MRRDPRRNDLLAISEILEAGEGIFEGVFAEFVAEFLQLFP